MQMHLLLRYALTFCPVSMEITFKKATKTDLGSLLQVLKEAAQKISKKRIDHWQYWIDPPTEKVNWVKEGIANGEYFFINHKGDSLGIIRILDQDRVYWSASQNRDRAKYIHSLVIFEAYNGKGMGQKVIEAVTSLARKENCSYLRLDCDAHNSKLCQYYEKQGFIKVTTKRFPYSINNLYERKVEDTPAPY